MERKGGANCQLYIPANWLAMAGWDTRSLLKIQPAQVGSHNLAVRWTPHLHCPCLYDSIRIVETTVDSGKSTLRIPIVMHLNSFTLHPSIE